MDSNTEDSRNLALSHFNEFVSTETNGRLRCKIDGKVNSLLLCIVCLIELIRLFVSPLGFTNKANHDRLFGQ